MGSVKLFQEDLYRLLPAHLRNLMGEEWVPWKWVAQRHSDLPPRETIALFEAYHHLTGFMPLRELAALTLPEDSDGCQRCGTCCAWMRPGAVSASTYRRWRERGASVSLFYEPVNRRKNPRYSCWFYSGTRLRMCPLLLQNRLDGKPFCSIHSQGRGYRPPACIRFRPKFPICALDEAPLVP